MNTNISISANGRCFVILPPGKGLSSSVHNPLSAEWLVLKLPRDRIGQGWSLFQDPIYVKLKDWRELNGGSFLFHEMVMTEAKNQNPEYSIKKHYSTDLYLAMLVLQLFLQKLHTMNHSKPYEPARSELMGSLFTCKFVYIWFRNTVQKKTWFYGIFPTLATPTLY